MPLSSNNLLFFVVARNRFQVQGLDPPEATRRALPVLLVRPAVLGFLLSNAFSQTKASAVSSVGGDGTSSVGAAHGLSLLTAAGVPARERYFPPFIHLSPRQAHEEARLHGIHVDTVHKADLADFKDPVVVAQDPKAGVNREEGMDSVKLTFGERHAR
jgi:hypothetical protein